MSRADEKMAFEAMMAEIDDDSEDEREYAAARSTAPSGRYSQASGASQRASHKETGSNGYGYPNSSSNSSAHSGSGMYRADAKSTESHSGHGYAKSTDSRTTATRTSTTASKMSKEEQDIENFGSAANAQTAAEAHVEQMTVTKRWLVRPVSRGERSAMKCFVERERSGFGMSTTYRCFLEGVDGQPARFMMSAKKKTGKQSSYYLISLDLQPNDDRGAESVLGKIRGNTIGSRYIITDQGIAPEKTASPSMFRKEYCVVGFEFDSGGPSRIDAWIPSVSPSGVASVFQPTQDSECMESYIDEITLQQMNNHNPSGTNSTSQSYSNRNIIYLQNKQPKWDEAHGGHVLNFQGRVTESSVKNFQLCSAQADDSEEVILQFGRVGKHKFNMDLRYPMSPIQAFGICVACMDGKIADRKGYEMIKKLTTSAPPNAAAAATNANGNTNNNNNNNTLGSGLVSFLQGNSTNDDAAHASSSRQRVDGSMTGNQNIGGKLRDSLPSGQYLKDKFYRAIS